MRATLSLCCLTLTGCPQSSTDVAEEVIEQAIAFEQRERKPPPTGLASTDRCVAMPGELVAATHDMSIGRHVWEGSLYWPTQRDLRVLKGNVFEPLMSFTHTATASSPSDAGWFFITQDDDVKTRLVWRANDGSVSTTDAPAGFLLSEVLAVAEGAYVTAGSTRPAAGPTGLVLKFDIKTRRLAPLVDRNGGILDLHYDDGLLYWIEYPRRGKTESSRIVAHKPGTTSFVTLAENSAGFDSIELHGKWLYWVESGPDFESGPIMRAHKTGGPAKRVHDPVGRSLAFAGDTFFVRAGDSKVLRIDPSSGASAVFLEGAPLISLPTVGSREIYWTAGPAGTGHVAMSQCIYRTARPLQPSGRDPN